MKTKELNGLNQKELEEKLRDLRMELIKQNAQVATGTNPKSPGQIREIKKNIAKILTVLKNKRSV